MTNFVTAGFLLKKQESDSFFILQRTPDILVRHVQTVCLRCAMSFDLPAGLINFICQLSIEV